MNYYIVHDNVRLGRVGLDRVEFPNTRENVKLPLLFTGELVAFSEYERIRPIVLAQNIDATDLGAPWNTTAEQAALEEKYLKAVEKRPDMPSLELCDEGNVKVRVSSLRIAEFEKDGEAVIYVTVVFPDNEEPAAVKR